MSFSSPAVAEPLVLGQAVPRSYRCSGKVLTLIGLGLSVLLGSKVLTNGVSGQQEPGISMLMQPARIMQSMQSARAWPFLTPGRAVAPKGPAPQSQAGLGLRPGLGLQHTSFGLSSGLGPRAGLGPGTGRKFSGVVSAERVPVNSPQDELKRQCGYKAVDDYVKSGTVIGLGTGSTAAFAVERVGDKLASGELKDILAVPTSERTKEQAEALGIPLVSLNERSDLDVAIDGADTVDPQLNLVKGGGGALLREKLVEVKAKKFIVIVDDSKMAPIGPHFPLPVEIVPFSHEATMKTIAALPSLAGSKAVLRLGSSSNNKPDGDKPAITDNGNYIVDLFFDEPMKDVPAAAEQLKNTVGVVDHGLFIGMTTACIIAGADGVTVQER